MTFPLTAAVNLTARFPELPGAACVGTDPEDFFPPTGGGAPAAAAYARDICAPCPARLECLEWALKHDEWGVWGGTTDKERRRILRKSRR